MLETKGHGSIRKVKGGAVGVLALSTLFIGVGAVSANETTPTEQSSVEVTTKQDSLVKEEVKEDKAELPQKEEPKQEAKVEKEVPKDTTKETYKKAENKEFDFAKETAKENGVSLKEDTKPAIKDNEKDAQDDLSKQTKSLKDATKTQIGADAITNLDKEKLSEAGIKVVENKVKVFTDLKQMEDFVKKQSKEIATDIETKHNIDKEVQLQTEELKQAGIEVVVGEEVVKSSPKEALKALEDLQQQVKTAVKTKQELDSAYLALQERAKSEGLLTKESKVLTLKNAKEAKEYLENQTKEVNELISSLKQENTKLLTAIANAESYGITVSKGTIKTASLKEATEHISKQVEELNQLVKSVEGSKSLISSAVDKAKKEGVQFEGENVINSAKGETNLNEKVSNAVKELSEAVTAQTNAKQELLALIQGAKAKGLEVNISGNKKVNLSGVSAELATIKAQIEDALSKQAKAQADYQSALAKAQSSGRLIDGSTAKQEGNVYKQTLSIHSEGTGGTININTSGSADIVSLELLDPNGSKIESVKTLADLNAYKAFDKKGTYTVNYTFKAKDNTAGSVTSKATTNGIEGVIGSAQGTITLTTKAPLVTNKENQVAPLTIAHVYDYSSSYAGKLKDSLRLSKKIIEANSPESKHIFLGYGQNYDTTYAANMADTVGVNGFASKLLSKDQALSLIDKLLKINAPSEKDPTYTNYPAYFQGVADTFGEFRYKDASVTPDRFGRAMKPFEDIIEKFTKPTDTVSVIQYTDGWMLGYRPDGKPTETSEEIDKTFADWAKKRAKTFMSVINRNQVTNEDTNSLRSIQQMESVGHPNIYDMTGKDKGTAEQEIVAQFLETATEKITTKKGENQLVKVSIGGNGVTVTKAVLKGATTKELAIKDGKVDFSEKLADGNYSVEFVVEGNGTVTTVVTIDGKEVTKKSADIKSTAGSKGSSATVTDKLNALVLPTAPKSQPITVNDITVVAKKPVLGTVESEVATVTTEKELNKVTFKETVTPISFERTVTPAQAEVTTHDVYTKTDKAVKTLPNTGTADSSMTEVAGAGLGLVGLLSLYGLKRKED